MYVCIYTYIGDRGGAAGAAADAAQEQARAFPREPAPAGRAGSQ